MEDRDPKKRSLEEYGKLAHVLAEKARKLGLYIQQTAIVPPFDDDSPVIMQATFAVGEVAAEGMQDTDVPEREQIEGADDDKDMFDAIIAGDAKHEREQLIAEMKDDFDNEWTDDTGA